jgi:tRNA (guanine10-N2)-dimethyltransferase
MNCLFEISKEHITIPKSEIFSSLDANKIDFDIIESNDDVIILKAYATSKIINKLSERLSYTNFIDEFLFSSKPSLKNIKKNSLDHKINISGTIAIKYKNRSNKVDSQPIVKTLAEVYTKNRKVDLENPDIEIRVLITDNKIYVGLKIAEIDRSKYEERKVQNRPFFSPISLHPKLARALVNISTIKKGEILLDPFCGTGGILIEAGLIGVKIIGSDIEEKMINGCRKTLDFYKINNYKLFCSDIGDVHKLISKVDAIVTDLPYGKSTTTKGEKMDLLYERAFESMSKLIKDKKFAVIGLSDKKYISLGQKYFRLVETHALKVHRSLERYFVVFEK